MNAITIKLEYLKKFTAEVKSQSLQIEDLQDKYDVIADEEVLIDLIAELEYLKDVVASIKIA